MGFWHTGYMEHHEDAFFGDQGWLPGGAPAPPRFFCPDCDWVFDQREDLEKHRWEGHSYLRPALLFKGLECGRTRILISERTAPDDWMPLDCDAIVLNERHHQPSEIGRLLSQQDDGIVSITLLGDQTEQRLELEFRIADPQDLLSVDERLSELVHKQQLSLDSIEAFLSSTRDFRTASDYTAGIANYFYGVLAKERSPESNLPFDEYRSRFDEAAAILTRFNRAPSDAICGLIAFHYNQFESAIGRGSARVEWVANRLLRLLRLGGDLTAPRTKIRPGIEFALSDAGTEQVLGWCSLPFDDTATSDIREIEDGLAFHEPFDQLKLRVIAAEHHLRSGRLTQALHHANELRHNPLAEAWARSVIGRSSGETT